MRFASSRMYSTRFSATTVASRTAARFFSAAMTSVTFRLVPLGCPLAQLGERAVQLVLGLAVQEPKSLDLGAGGFGLVGHAGPLFRRFQRMTSVGSGQT
ncbi:hypothetical protein ACFWMR_02200 [Amycolatopsis thailandensis]|uniref:hypothetical protein n=1 Tax=Amycolatopsis thailandensis TaxID=589330 RepID=UPI00365DB2CE